MNKLNFGCGSIQPEGWINLDFAEEFNAPYKVIDEVEENSLDIIVAHACIQQTEWHDLVPLLEVLRSKLRVGGVLRISLPDFVTGFKEYLDGNIDWLPNGESDIDDRFSAWVTWYSTTCTLLTEKALINKLLEAGFESYLTHGVPYQQTLFKERQESTELDTREKEFYFVEALK